MHLYQGKVEENLSDVEPISIKEISGDEENTIKSLFYDNKYSVTTDGTFGLDIDALKVRCAPPKIDMDETLKAMRVSMIESQERTAQIRARHEWLKNACSRDENHEDLKVLGVSPLESLFSRVKPFDGGAGYESTLVEKRPNDSESIYLDAKSIKSGVEDVKTLSSNEITTLDFKEFN